MAHGGSIVCSSEPGQGTRFVLYFPAIHGDNLIRDEQQDDLTTAGSLDSR